MISEIFGWFIIYLVVSGFYVAQIRAMTSSYPITWAKTLKMVFGVSTICASVLAMITCTTYLIIGHW